MSVSSELLCSFELLKPLDSSALKSHIKKGRNKRNSMLNSPPVSISLDGGTSNRRRPAPPCDPASSSSRTDSVSLFGGPKKSGLFGGYDDLFTEPSFQSTEANPSAGVCATTKCIEDGTDYTTRDRSSEASIATTSSDSASTISFTKQHKTKSPDKNRIRRVSDTQLKARRWSN